MIDQILKAIIEDLNNSIKRKFDVSESKIILSNLVNQDGSVPKQNSNNIICSLINIEQEQIRSNGGFRGATGIAQKIPIQLNLSLMFSSNYYEENYLEGLKLLSIVIEFFESKALFTTANTPKLPPSTEKIQFSIYNLDIGSLNHLWGALGAKSMPSVIYQVKMISVLENRLLEAQSGIANLSD